MAVPKNNYFGPHSNTQYITSGGQAFDQRDLASTSAVGANEEILSFLGQLDKTDAQKNYLTAKDAQRHSSAEAQKTRDWEKMMSDTSWQRGVADMQAAGINPALAYSQGGASSPSGAMAQSASSSGSGDSPLTRLGSGLLTTALATAGGVAGKVIGAKIASNSAADTIAKKASLDMEKELFRAKTNEKLLGLKFDFSKDLARYQKSLDHISYRLPRTK